MTTYHEEAASALLERYMGMPGASAVLIDTVNDWRAGSYDRRYVARIGQTTTEPGSWPMEQVAAFVSVHTDIMAGRVSRILVEVGEAPGSDRDRKGNAEKLREVSGNFSAKLNMGQYGAEGDGTLTWDAVIRTGRSTGVPLLVRHGPPEPVIASCNVRPGTAVLEVGYTKPSRTLMHLYQRGMVARWAYGDDLICLFVDVGRNRHLRASEGRAALEVV